MASKSGFDRRDFLKVIGAGAGLAAAGCSKELPEKIIPYVIQPDEVIPGVATWYCGSCFQCSAGCGITVRTREGRAVKIEGNPDHPINAGGLCAHGQSALQVLYDPDRIREPLERDTNGVFKPVSWEKGIEGVGQAIANLPPDKEVVIITNPLSGSLSSLMGEFVKKIPRASHYEYQLLNSDVVDMAAEQCFGEGMRTHFDFSKAEVIVSFGADYLESWLSPVEFARGWAMGRKPTFDGRMNYVVHFEPRLSLTGANADKWLMTIPGSEPRLMTALWMAVAKIAKSKEVDESRLLLPKQDVNELLKGTGVEEQQIHALAERLVKARSSLVIAGGATVSGANAILCANLANLINHALGNIGKTIQVIRSSRKKAELSSTKLQDLIQAIAAKQKKVGVLLLSGTNLAYTLPKQSGFAKAVAATDLVVGVSTHLDETTTLAQVVLPLSTSLESWLDSEPMPGMYNLNQPAMQPLYKTQSLGDTVLALGHKLNVSFGDVGSFYDYLREKWKARVATASTAGQDSFESLWQTWVEHGGDWSGLSAQQVQQRAIPLTRLFSHSLESLEKAFPAYLDNGKINVGPGANSLSPRKKKLLAYPSVTSFDGTAANRPWMQELPSPLTTAVWGSWVELHPELANEQNIKTGDVVQVLTAQGSIEAPAYVTKHIHPDLVAVPIGQGHERFGRYAAGMGTNPLAVLPASDKSPMSFMADVIELRPVGWSDKLVTAQEYDSQEKRNILRSLSIVELTKQIEERASHSTQNKYLLDQPAYTSAEELRESRSHPATKVEGKHGREGHPALEPPQMYRQMEHPNYRWGMSIDLASCTGCSACVVACYAENNIAVVGKDICAQGRDMAWIRIDRYFDGPEDHPVDGFMPMMCQHCGNAPCEPVCPVYATYHNEEGLNAMLYNRCVGTRYCANNCSYKVRRFNWYHYTRPEPLNWQLNPDVTVREVGVMEKCTFCVQRIREVTNKAKDLGRTVLDGEIQPACASSCPTKAITFGNLLDKSSQVYLDSQGSRAYRALDEALNTQPAISYLARVRAGV